jgi:hypothetical protein
MEISGRRRWRRRRSIGRRWRRCHTDRSRSGRGSGRPGSGRNRNVHKLSSFSQVTIRIVGKFIVCRRGSGDQLQLGEKSVPFFFGFLVVFDLFSNKKEKEKEKVKELVDGRKKKTRKKTATHL